MDYSSQVFEVVLKTRPSIQFSQDWSSEHDRQSLIQGIQLEPDLNEPGTHLKQIPPSNRMLEPSHTH